jgi:hypothetical protein
MAEVEFVSLTSISPLFSRLTLRLPHRCTARGRLHSRSAFRSPIIYIYTKMVSVYLYALFGALFVLPCKHIFSRADDSRRFHGAATAHVIHPMILPFCWLLFLLLFFCSLPYLHSTRASADLHAGLFLHQRRVRASSSECTAQPSKKERRNMRR